PPLRTNPTFVSCVKPPKEIPKNSMKLKRYFGIGQI
ncbi:MAG: hypothetical protein ACI85Q_002749, partial [Salibacteraceae bacterium]